MSLITEFHQTSPSLESFWRALILFGRNTSSYKFALSKSLLNIAPTGKSIITLEDLAIPFAAYLCEHIKEAPRQGTNATNSLFKACNEFNAGLISREELVNQTLKNGFKYVFDAFHNVNGEPIPVQFFEKDFNGKSKKLILTDDIFKLADGDSFPNLIRETEARWRLVEKAWEMGLSNKLLTVDYNSADNMLYEFNNVKRRTITSARDALNGYQKGKCFYCFDDISVSPSDPNLCDIDHFFPHTLQSLLPNVNLDGVWNLVLTCKKCNRGVDGKYARVPAIKYLERLYKRNEYLITSHHPLRETLIAQTGATPEQRHRFLAEIDAIAINYLIHRWDTETVTDEEFF